jgi:hypothetical protein
MGWYKESVNAVKKNLAIKNSKSMEESVLDGVIGQRLHENRQRPRMQVVLPNNVNRFYEATLQLERKKALLKQVRDSARARAREEMKGFKGYIPPKKKGLMGDLPN